MSVKTVRFNKKEEALLKKVLKYYKGDFSSCVKALLQEKLEDLQDIQSIQNLKESDPKDYLSGDDLDAMYGT